LIEVRGARQAFVASFVAINKTIKGDTIVNQVAHEIAFRAANSEDEAYGWAMKAVEKAYPHTEGWTFHNVVVKRIDNINSIGDT
jgi:hypothetical protein